MPVFVRNFSIYYYTALLLSLYPFGIDGQQQNQLGDTCQLSHGLYGKCKLLESCLSESAYVKIEVICAYQNHIPIVCCPPKSSLTRPPKKSTTTGFALPSTDSPWLRAGVTTEPEAPGALATRKCAEYAKAAFRIVRPPILPGFDVEIKDVQCTIKSPVLIVGGTQAEPREFPPMVAVGFVPKSNLSEPPLWACGGTLISDEFVLTAAHCISDFEQTAHWIRLGDLNIAKDNDIARPRTIRIAEKIAHPEYDARYRYHDIAVFKLESKVTFSPWMRPACLVHVDRHDDLYIQVEKPVQQVMATGWGAVGLGDVKSDHLLKVVLNMTSHQGCNDSWAGNRLLPEGIIDQWQMCARGAKAGRDTCQGDSGGPLLVYNQDHECMYDVVGITSIGTSCAQEAPAIYTRVENYLSWLEKTVWR